MSSCCFTTFNFSKKMSKAVKKKKLPNWTAESIIHSHESRPLNPLIANAFYRAGYIESWGRGIQLIKDSCRKLGTPEPEYTVIGDALRIKFTALESAKITEQLQPNQQNKTSVESLEDKILNELRINASFDQKTIAEKLQIPISSLQRAFDKLRKEKRIIRRGGKRYGYWEIKQ